MSNHISNFYKVRLSGWQLYVSKDFAASGRQHKLEADEKLDGIRGPFIKEESSRFADVFKCSISFAGYCHNVFVKRYLHRSAWDFVKHIFRPSRAKRALLASIMLKENGLGIAEVIAMGQKKYGPFCVSNFLITRELEDAQNVHNCITEKWQTNTKNTLLDKRRFIVTLGKTIGKMHAAGIFHGDLRTGNVFAGKVNGDWEFFFLDNERTRRFRRIGQRLRIKNLVQINMLEPGLVSATERMRFFKSYLKANQYIQHRYKNMQKQVVSKTNYRLSKY